MKNWKQNVSLCFMAIIILVFFACDGGNNEQHTCTCPVGTIHEPNENCCNKTGCNCSIAEPDQRNFDNIIFFVDNETEYMANIYDARIACGSKTLEQLGIIELLQNIIEDAYNKGNFITKARLRNYFSWYDNNITIVIINSGNYYDFPTFNIYEPDKIIFHIDWLKSESDDIQEKMLSSFSTVMNTENISVIFNYTAASMVSITTQPFLNDITIYYTIDGSEPNINSNVYIEPFTITETTTIRAFGTIQYYSILLETNVFNKNYNPAINFDTWTVIDNHLFDDIYCIAFGGGTFISAGNGGKIARSTDNGLTWIPVDIILDEYSGISSIAYSGNTFIAIGRNVYDGSFIMIRSIDNGITWTAIENKPLFKYSLIGGIAYGNNTFVVVAGDEIARSIDNGMTWTIIPMGFEPDANNQLRSITYGDNVFIAGCDYKIFRSTDNGITWIAIENIPSRIMSICFSNNIFIAGGDSHGSILRSTDNGLTWTRIFLAGNANNRITNIVYGRNTLILVGGWSGSKLMAQSADNGFTWTVIEENIFENIIISTIAYGNNTFVVGSNDKMAFSTGR